MPTNCSSKFPSLTVTVPDATHVRRFRHGSVKVSQFAAELRQLRKPEPYKGKGVRYQGERSAQPGKAASK